MGATAYDLATMRPSGDMPVPAAPPPAPIPPAEPSAVDLLGAGFRQSNVVGSWLADGVNGFDNAVDETYSLAARLKADPSLEKWVDDLAWANNDRTFDALVAQKRMEEQDRKTIEAGGWLGTLSEVGNAVFDPTILFPGGQLVRATKGGYSIARSALMIGVAGGAGASVQEAILQATQQDRSLAESAINVGAATVLSAVLGGGAAALLTRAEARASSRAMHALHTAAQGDVPPVRATAEVRAALREAEARAGAVGAVEAPAVRETPDVPVAAVDDAVDKVGTEIKTEGWAVHPVESADDLADVVASRSVALTDTQAAKLDQLGDMLTRYAVVTKEGEDAPRFVVVKGDDAIRKAVAEALPEERVVSPQQLAAAIAKGDEGRAPSPLGLDGQAASAGAAAVTSRSRESLGVAGRATNAIAAATAFSPAMRGMQRLSAKAREVTALIADNSVYTVGNMAGDTVGSAASTAARSSYSAALMKAVQGHTDAYKAMKRAGTNMSRREFEDAVGAAMRNGDEGVNKFVSGAAREWRSKVFDPYLKQAVELGLLPPDVKVETALSYFSRVYDKAKLIAHEGEFKARVAPYVQQQMEIEFSKDQQALIERTGRLDRDIADMSITASEDRAARLKALKAQGDALDANNPEAVDLLSRANELRQRAKTAPDETPYGHLMGQDPTKTKQALLKAARELEESGGPALEAYKKARAELRRQYRNTDFSYAGVADRIQQTNKQLVDLEDANIRSMESAIRKGEAFLKKKLDVKKREQGLVDLRTTFANAANEADAAARAAAEKRAKLQDELEAQAKAAAEGGDTAKAADIDADMNRRLQKLLAQEAEKFGKRYDRLQAIAKRLETTENLDLEARLAAAQESVDRMTSEVSNLTMTRGERAARLTGKLAILEDDFVAKRIAALEQRKREFTDTFERRWGAYAPGEADGTVDLSGAAREIVDDIFQKISGKAVVDGSADAPWKVPITRGPMKDRVFNVPDQLLTGRPGETNFLVDNVREVGERYARTMAGEIELTRRFGNADLKDKIAEIAGDYRRLRERVIEAPDDATAQAIAGTSGTKAEILTKLDKDERGAIEDVAALRDLLRGTYKAAENASNWGRVVKGLMAFNYVTKMGGVLISSLSEVFRPAMVHGFGIYMKDGIAPLLTNLKAVRMSVAEANAAGVAAERILHHRMMAMAEIGDPYAHGTAFERLLTNATRLASTWNGLTLWTDTMKGFSSVMSQNRIIRGVLGQEKDTAYLAYLGIDANRARSMAARVRAFGQDLDGVWVANTEKWTDGLTGPALREAEADVRAYREAVAKDVNSIIVERDIGDVPLFANTPTGRLLLQFRSFNMAAHQKVFLRGLQEGPRNFVGGVVAMSTMGLLAAYLRSWRGGAERHDKWMKAAENPGFLLGEAFDVGWAPLFYDGAGIIEKTTPTGFNPLKTPLQWAFPDKSQQGASSRFAARDPLSAVLGPSAGIPKALMDVGAGVAGAVTGQGFGKHNLNQLQAVTPFGSHPGPREFLQILTGNSPYWE